MPARQLTLNDRLRGLLERPPLPPELARSPVLAPLTILDAALAVADHALLAEHPDLWTQDRPSWAPPPDAPARSAETIIVLARRLRSSLTRYRYALEKRDQDSRAEDIPF